MQLTIEHAIAAGEAGMGRALDAAERDDAAFSVKAQTAILAHLANAPGRQAAGEDLVDAAINAGARCRDARAFGGVFQSLSRRGLIRTVAYTVRKKGHGTAGGRIWALCQ